MICMHASADAVCYVTAVAITAELHGTAASAPAAAKTGLVLFAVSADQAVSPTQRHYESC